MANARRDRTSERRASGLRRRPELAAENEQSGQSLLDRIRELEEQNRELVSTEERFRLLAENAYDVVFRYQLEPHSGFEYVSPSVVAMTGYTPEELYDDAGLAAQIVLASEETTERQHSSERDDSPGDERLGRPTVVELICRDGTTRWVELRRSGVYDESGGLAAIEGIARDVTDRHHAELALEQAYAELDQRVRERTESLTRANEALVAEIARRERVENELRQAQKLEAVGTLASGVAHDFNNSLQSIIGCADLALGRFDPVHPAARYVYQLRDTAVSAAGIVDQLMQFSYRRETEPRVMDLNRLLAARDTLLRRLIGEDVKLRMAMGPAEAPIRCDPTQIEQVLMNLAINARHAMPHGGHLKIRTEQRWLGPHDIETRPGLDEGHHVVLSVQDDGLGMDERVRQRVFEPFFTTKPSEQGTGLGLATAYGIIASVGGHIEVASKPGAGTTFTIFFPRAVQPLQSDITELALGGQRGDERILVVEDEPLVRMVTRHYLERHGYEVLEANDVDSATRILEQSAAEIDLLLTDVVLPSGDGSMLATRALELKSGLRVVYMSGHAADRVVAERRLDPELPILQKPFTERHLVLRIREALGAGAKSPGSGAEPSVPGAAKASGTASAQLAVAEHAATGRAAAEEPASSQSAAGPSPGASPRSSESAPGHTTILLVEDEAAARMASRELLESEGYRVIETGSGAQALEAWQRHGPSIDLVISDLGLPDMAGTDLLGRLREGAPALPFVLLSGRPKQDPMVQSALGLPRVSYQQKPVQIASIVEQVERLLVPRPY